MPVQPKLIGTCVFKDYPLQDVVAYIDWNPFFQASWLTCLSACDSRFASP